MVSTMLFFCIYRNLKTSFSIVKNFQFFKNASYFHHQFFSGEMFSAKNMAKLAKSMFSCEAEKVTASSTPLTDLEKLLQLIGFEQKIIMVPYDSDADQWPCTRKGERAHWGLGTVLNRDCCKKMDLPKIRPIVENSRKSIILT